MNYFHELFPRKSYKIAIFHAEEKFDNIPDGRYAFLEKYCCNLECNCTDVVIEIEPQSDPTANWFDSIATPIAIMNYAWDKPFSDDNPVIINYKNNESSEIALNAKNLFVGYVLANPDYGMQFHQHSMMMKKTNARGENDDHKIILKNEKKIGRNDSCPCGSHKKFKKCCYKK
tara:strand:+ start:113 stop:631 length:519 start_codon:yes stop_codon:yes gene_type:complete